MLFWNPIHKVEGLLSIMSYIVKTKSYSIPTFIFLKFYKKSLVVLEPQGFNQKFLIKV